jgi:hypothetical protein
MKRYIVGLACFLYLANQQPTANAGAELSLRADVSEALQGGPVVIKGTLTNQSGKTLEFAEDTIWSSRLRFEAPSSWNGRAIPGRGIGPGYRIRKISSKEEWVETIFVH